MSGSTILSLSLFIILLAFFIVLNGISSYEEGKVDQAFGSLDYAFSTNILENDFEQQTADERASDDNGSGDSLEDVQVTLRAILPSLNMEITTDPNGGKDMVIRIKKDKFEKISSQLLPVFIRILNLRDFDQRYVMKFQTSVRDVLAPSSVKSFEIIESYQQQLINKGVSSDRISLSVETGNPADLKIYFEQGRSL